MVKRLFRDIALAASCGLIAVNCSQVDDAGSGPRDAAAGGASSGHGGATSGAGGATSGAGGSSGVGGATSGAGGAGGASGVGGATSGASGSSGLGGMAGRGDAGIGGASGAGGSGGTAGASGAAGNGGAAGRSDAGIGGKAGAAGASGTGGAAGTGQAGAAGSAGMGGTGDSGSTAMIRNDVFWKDTSGNFIYSQGGGVLRVGSTYYWYGVYYGGAATYAANPVNQNSDTSFVAITTYSSTDLANWKFEGNALTHASMASKLTMSPRPGSAESAPAYNANTKKYVIVGQYLGTPDTQQFFATSDAPNGAFEVQGTQAVLTNVVNNNCGDQSIFTDDDGQAYIVCSSLEGRSNTLCHSAAPFGLSAGRARDEDLRRRGPRGQRHVQVQWPLLRVLLGPARLERISRVLHLGHEHSRPVLGRDRDGQHGSRLLPRHADGPLHHRQRLEPRARHLRRRPLERLRGQWHWLQSMDAAHVRRHQSGHAVAQRVVN